MQDNWASRGLGGWSGRCVPRTAFLADTRHVNLKGQTVTNFRPSKWAVLSVLKIKKKKIYKYYTYNNIYIMILNWQLSWLQVKCRTLNSSFSWLKTSCLIFVLSYMTVQWYMRKASSAELKTCSQRVTLRHVSGKEKLTPSPQKAGSQTVGQILRKCRSWPAAPCWHLLHSQTCVRIISKQLDGNYLETYWKVCKRHP